eukprot:10914-Amorphochlora_amoeboformis.AAC.1
MPPMTTLKPLNRVLVTGIGAVTPLGGTSFIILFLPPPPLSVYRPESSAAPLPQEMRGKVGGSL